MRPFYDYFTQGEDAWFEGKNEGHNPCPEDSLAWQEWHRGNLYAETNHNSDFDQDRDYGRLIYFEEAVSHSRFMQNQLKRDLPTVEDVAEAINVPVEKWPGNCYAISSMLLDSGLLDDYQGKHGKLFLTFGKYTGPLSTDSPFAGKPIIQHGWLESPHGFIVDPTRWVFEQIVKEVWAGVITDYDMGGSRLHMKMRPGVPDPEGKMVRLMVNDPSVLKAIDRLLNGKAEATKTGEVSTYQLHWLANLPLETLSADAAGIYTALKASNAAGLIPQDNRKWVEDYISWEEDKAYKANSIKP